jgi:hypothetical protein
MSAPADLADAITSEQFLSTLTGEPAAETPTPAPAPETDEERPDAAADTPTTQASADTPAPAADTPAPAPETPPAETPRWQIDLAAERERAARAEREAATLRGQVQNAAQQADARARLEERQRLEADFQRRSREQAIRDIDEAAATGQYTPEQIAQAKQFRRDQWATEDAAGERQSLMAERSNMKMGEVALDIDHATVRLEQAGIASFARQAELPEADARQFFTPDEVRRYQRAVGQSRMARVAEELTGGRTDAGYNRAAADDYLQTVYQGLRLAGDVRRALAAEHAASLAARDKRIADLELQLNRADAGTVPPETPARGGARPRQVASIDDITTDDWMARLSRSA